MTMVKEENENMLTEVLFNIFNVADSLSVKKGERIAKMREVTLVIFICPVKTLEQVRNG